MNQITLRDTSSSIFLTCSKIKAITYHDADCLILFLKKTTQNKKIKSFEPTWPEAWKQFSVAISAHRNLLKCGEFYVMLLKLRILSINFFAAGDERLHCSHSPLEASFFLLSFFFFPLLYKIVRMKQRKRGGRKIYCKFLIVFLSKLNKYLAKLSKS